jgi:hypothetical protein
MSEDWSTVNYRDGGKHWNGLKGVKRSEKSTAPEKLLKSNFI